MRRSGQFCFPSTEIKILFKDGARCETKPYEKKTYLRFAFGHALCHVARLQIQGISLQQRKENVKLDCVNRFIPEQIISKKI